MHLCELTSDLLGCKRILSEKREERRGKEARDLSKAKERHQDEGIERGAQRG